MIGGRVVLAVVALAVCLVGFADAVLAAKQSTRTALLGSNAPSGPVLPVACNLANTTSQAILAATQVGALQLGTAKAGHAVTVVSHGCRHLCKPMPTVKRSLMRASLTKLEGVTTRVPTAKLRESTALAPGTTVVNA